MKDQTLTFKEMCARFDVTPRTLRYYEYIELLSPLKDGRSRLYGPREVARMTLILRGRRFGFSLEEIRQWLLIYLQMGTREQNMVLIEKAGVIRLFQNTPGVSAGSVQTFLNISSRVYTSSDSGMTAIVFHPEFGVPGSTNRGFVYVTYKWRPNPDLGANGTFAYYRLSRFNVPDGTMAADTLRLEMATYFQRGSTEDTTASSGVN